MKLTEEQIDVMKEDLCADIIEIIMHEWNFDMTKAMDMFYNSDTFQRMKDSETGLNYPSPGYVYDFFCNELRLGTVE